MSEREQDATNQPVPAELTRYTQLPESLPDQITAVAQRVVDNVGARTPYAKAEALRDYFWDNFQYDVTVDPADDASAIQRFLTERRGFCVQFASAYAVMARSLGIPARVAVGFTPGQLDNGVFTVRSHDARTSGRTASDAGSMRPVRRNRWAAASTPVGSTDPG